MVKQIPLSIVAEYYWPSFVSEICMPQIFNRGKRLFLSSIKCTLEVLTRGAETLNWRETTGGRMEMKWPAFSGCSGGMQKRTCAISIALHTSPHTHTCPCGKFSFRECPDGRRHWHGTEPEADQLRRSVKQAAVPGSLKTTLCLANCCASPGARITMYQVNDCIYQRPGGGPHSHKLLISISQRELYDMQAWKCGILSFRGACSRQRQTKCFSH